MDNTFRDIFHKYVTFYSDNISIHSDKIIKNCK